MSRERANRVHAVVNVQNVFVRRRDRGKRVRERRIRNHANRVRENLLVNHGCGYGYDERKK